MLRRLHSGVVTLAVLAQPVTARSVAALPPSVLAVALAVRLGA